MYALVCVDDVRIRWDITIALLPSVEPIKPVLLAGEPHGPCPLACMNKAEESRASAANRSAPSLLQPRLFNSPSSRVAVKLVTGWFVITGDHIACPACLGHCDASPKVSARYHWRYQQERREPHPIWSISSCAISSEVRPTRSSLDCKMVQYTV